MSEEKEEIEEGEIKQRPHGKILTIPNIMSFFRIAIIPLFIWLYIGKNDYIAAAVVVLISCTSDVLDGYIARKFNQISDYGKALDPLADKLTQASVMACLLTRFPHILAPLTFIVIKEVTSFFLGLAMFRKTGLVKGAVWHGKVNTVLIFLMMFMHLLWPGIPGTVSDISIGICLVMMTYSFIRYSIRYIRVIRAGHDVEEKHGNKNTRN